MTNEDIEQKAVEVLAAIERVPAEWIRDSAHAQDIPLIADVIREVVSQAYEEAARSQCWNCEDERPVVFLRGPQHADSHSSQSIELTGYVHRIEGEQAGRTFLYPCAAGKVRALKDSLALEPVAST